MPLISCWSVVSISFATVVWARPWCASPHPVTPSSVVIFTATAIPNLPDQVRIFSGDGQSGPVNTDLSEPLVLYVGDQFDNPFPGQQIEWLITAGSGTLSASLSVSDDAGLARTFLTLGSTPGDVNILARFPSAQTGPRATFTATATP